MKVWLIVAIVAGLFVLGGLAVVQALDKPVADSSETSTTSPSYSCGASGGSCNGGCTAENNCGMAGCRAATGGSCGCGR
jgi:hypothetical protein